MPARLRPLLGEWGRKLPHTIPCKISQFQQFIVQPIEDYLREIFIRLLLHSEERGPHTSGLAGLKIDDTLKRGYWNHQRFCAQDRSIEPAMVWGRLYHLNADFPALEVPEGLILARGTADPLADARRHKRSARIASVARPATGI